MKSIVLKYNHPAVARHGIDIKKTYSLGKDDEGYFISNKKQKIYLDLDRISRIFEVVVGKEDFDKLINPNLEKKTKNKKLEYKRKNATKKEKVGD